MIAGTGIDIVETARVRRLIDRYGDSFVCRWFTDEEIAYCRSKANPATHFAAALAAKEAVIKVLRWDWRRHPIRLREISVTHDSLGTPSVRLSAPMEAQSRKLGVASMHLSLSHAQEYAVASVVAERVEEDEHRIGKAP